MHSLTEHGFLSIDLQDTLTNICEVIPHASEIASLGKEHAIGQEMWRFLDRSLTKTKDGRSAYVGWHIGELYREGTYGKIYKAFRMVVASRPDGLFDVAEAPYEVIVKTSSPPDGKMILPTEDVIAHASEALLHVLAWRIMQRTLTPWAIPRPYEVFGDKLSLPSTSTPTSTDSQTPVASPSSTPSPSSSPSSPPVPWTNMSFCMSYVSGRTLYSFMKKHWKPTTKQENSRALIEIMAQVAYILYYLQKYLRLNHRDVKVNNILIRTRKDPIILELADSRILTYYEITLIDFGFACVGCPPPKQPTTAFQAGSWFPFGELCCKKGRDLTQLLFCIHCYFPLEKYLTKEIYQSFAKWMQISCAGGVVNALRGFTEEGVPRPKHMTDHPKYDTGIYEFLRRPDVDPSDFDPRHVFSECCRLHLNTL